MYSVYKHVNIFPGVEVELYSAMITQLQQL